ncbi:ArsR/SmtB family transcription factor [Alsobacter sp. R-9]
MGQAAPQHKATSPDKTMKHLSSPPTDIIMDNAKSISTLLKTIANETRFSILLCLSERPHFVSELISRVGSRQAAVSQQLAILRQVGIVKTTRNGKGIMYSLTDNRVRMILDVLSADLSVSAEDTSDAERR